MFEQMYHAVDEERDQTPSARILLAVERIAQQGPMTLDDLRGMLDLSKTATWRTVATLRAAGWVRIGHGGRLIELDPRLRGLFAKAHFADAEFAHVVDVMDEVSARHAVHLDLFVADARGDIILLETTRRMKATAPPVDASDASIAIALQGAMTAPQLLRHLSLRSSRADFPTLRGTSTGHRMEHTPGYVHSADSRCLAVSVRGRMGTPAVLRIVPKSRRLRSSLLSDAFDSLGCCLQTHVEQFGRPRSQPVATG